MAKFTGAGLAAAANSTVANSGIIKLELGATVKPMKLYEWEFAPAANSENSNYGLWIQRQSSAGTWTTAVTPAPLDFINAQASTAVVKTGSTVAGTLITNSVLLQVGCNQAAGYRSVAVPGAEFAVGSTATPSTGHGVFLAYQFAQGTAVNSGSMSWDE